MAHGPARRPAKLPAAETRSDNIARRMPPLSGRCFGWHPHSRARVPVLGPDQKNYASRGPATRDHRRRYRPTTDGGGRYRGSLRGRSNKGGGRGSPANVDGRGASGSPNGTPPSRNDAAIDGQYTREAVCSKAQGRWLARSAKSGRDHRKTSPEPAGRRGKAQHEDVDRRACGRRPRPAGKKGPETGRCKRHRPPGPSPRSPVAPASKRQQRPGATVIEEDAQQGQGRGDRPARDHSAPLFEGLGSRDHLRSSPPRCGRLPISARLSRNGVGLPFHWTRPCTLRNTANRRPGVRPAAQAQWTTSACVPEWNAKTSRRARSAFATTAWGKHKTGERKQAPIFRPGPGLAHRARRFAKAGQQRGSPGRSADGGPR